MIGVDITKISRFKNAKISIVNKILHHNEKHEYFKIDKKEIFLASRWAIKEALFKADNSLLTYNNIEIKKNGRKYVYPGYKISTSKEDDYYIAIVMKESNEA